MTHTLVSTEWLAEHIRDHNVVVVDASWYMPATGRKGYDDYLKSHIPGGVFFGIDEIADKKTDLPHMLPSPAAFAHRMGRLGLTADDSIVVYDTVGIRSSALAVR